MNMLTSELPRSEPLPPATKTKRVLIVEDDRAAREALRTILSYQGYKISSASTVASAMEMLDPPLHAVVLDLMLPDGDGEVVLEALRDAGRRDVRVVVTTGVGDQDRLSELKSLHPDLILRKPIALANLLAAIA